MYMYDIPRTVIEFEDGTKVNQVGAGLRLVKENGDSTPVAAVTIRANHAVARDAHGAVVHEGGVAR